MTQGVFTVLDTTVAENGPDQVAKFDHLKDDMELGGTRFFVNIGSGDTVVIQGKAVSTDSYVTLQSITATGVYDVKLSPFWRAIRSVDGTSGDSTVRIVNISGNAIVEHTA